MQPSSPFYPQGLCITGSADDTCIRWSDVEGLSDEAEESVEEAYRPAFALCITAFALSCALSLLCAVQALFPLLKSLLVQVVLFAGCTITAAFLAVVLYETSSTYLTRPHNYDHCPDASSRGTAGYTACAIGVSAAATVAILSIWPAYGGLRSPVYDIQVQPHAPLSS